MNKKYLEINGARMAFLRFGEGSQLLVAIPGYGDRAVLFRDLEDSLSRKYIVYVLQLPHHGESIWPRAAFDKADFSEAIRQIMEIEKQKSLSLMGYSFGARVILSLLNGTTNIVSRIFLLAPDGFNQAYVRRATFLPQSFRVLLQSSLNKPNWFLRLAEGLHGIGLVKPYSYHFVELHLATEKRRKRLFLYWNSMDDFKYDEQKVAAILEQHSIPVILILGKEDRVIPTEKWRAWGEASSVVEVYLLDEKHRLVGKRMNDLLKQILV